MGFGRRSATFRIGEPGLRGPNLPSAAQRELRGHPEASLPLPPADPAWVASRLVNVPRREGRVLIKFGALEGKTVVGTGDSLVKTNGSTAAITGRSGLDAINAFVPGCAHAQRLRLACIPILARWFCMFPGVSLILSQLLLLQL